MHSLHDTLQTGIVCDMIMGEGKLLTFLQKINQFKMRYLFITLKVKIMSV